MWVSLKISVPQWCSSWRPHDAGKDIAHHSQSRVHWAARPGLRALGNACRHESWSFGMSAWPWTQTEVRKNPEDEKAGRVSTWDLVLTWVFLLRGAVESGRSWLGERHLDTQAGWGAGPRRVLTLLGLRAILRQNQVLVFCSVKE